MILVVATTEDRLDGVRTRLDGLGVEVTDVVAPSAVRRVVLAAVDEPDAERLAVALRAEGALAVTRPDGGPALDAWARHTRPVTVGDRLGVWFAWSEHERPDVAASVELGPGGFGSGAHPSTHLVLEELVRRIRGGERVLDVGCGSGVLGLGALGLGAAHVVALDLKPDAVAATSRNAALNGWDGRVTASLGPLGEIPGPFDVIVANVGRAALVELGPDLVARMAPGGWLAASGFSPSQCSLVAGFLEPLVELERRTAGEWAMVVLARADGPRRTGLVRVAPRATP